MDRPERVQNSTYKIRIVRVLFPPFAFSREPTCVHSSHFATPKCVGVTLPCRVHHQFPDQTHVPGDRTHTSTNGVCLQRSNLCVQLVHEWQRADSLFVQVGDDH